MKLEIIEVNVKVRSLNAKNVTVTQMKSENFALQFFEWK